MTNDEDDTMTTKLFETLASEAEIEGATALANVAAYCADALACEMEERAHIQRVNAIAKVAADSADAVVRKLEEGTLIHHNDNE